MSTYKVGSPGDMFDLVATGAGGESNVIDTGTLSNVSIFGMVHAAPGNINVYQGQSSNPLHMVYNKAKSEPTLTKVPDPPDWSDDGVSYKKGQLVKVTANRFWCKEDHVSNDSTRTTANTDLWIACGENHPVSFAIDLSTAARFVKVTVANDVTAFVTCAAKP